MLDKRVVKGSIVLVVAFGFFNLLGFLFQFFMAKMLTIKDYGILATLFSLIYISSIFTETIQNVIVKYSSNEKNNGKIKNLFNKSMRKVKVFSFFLFISYLILSIFLAKILEINYSLLAITGVIFVISCLIPISRGILQGKKRFKALSINMISEGISKLFVSIILVLFGVGVFGAITGVVVGALFGFLFSLFQIKEVLNSKEEKATTAGIYSYSIPSLIITSSVIIFYNLDVVLARIFFEPQISGSYAIASLLGKIIFWGTLPITKAMMPYSSENGKENKNKIFLTSLLVLLFGIIFVLAIFFLFPERAISIFSNDALEHATEILFYVGLAFGLISIANLILLYKLSINSTKYYSILPIFILLEIALMAFYSKSIIQFSMAFAVSSLIFVIGSTTLIGRRG